MIAQLGEILVNSGLLSKKRLEDLLEENKKHPEEMLGETAIRLGSVSDKDIARTLSLQLGFPLVDLAKTSIEPQAVQLLPPALATKYGIIPLQIEDGYLIVAMQDPLNIAAIDDAQFASGLHVRPVVATKSQIDDALTRHYRLSDALSDMTKNVAELQVTGSDEESAMSEAEIARLRRASDMAPAIRLVNGILLQGIQAGASDIHLESRPNEVVIRNRVDGMLHDAMRAPKWAQGTMISRLKIMAGMDITKHMIPQDGRIKVKAKGLEIDIRASALPTRFGEKIVLRLLSQHQQTGQLDGLGLEPKHLLRLRDFAGANEGMILVCGPTGSGKTTTLYAMINEVKDTQKNIVTVEDPVEYEVEGINQVQVNAKVGLTFANVLRSVLRQDPDVILVGEVRDNETAHIAMQSAMTGHLVLSTVHTVNAVAAITRLLNLGVDSYLVGSALKGVIAQRLLRRICPDCKTECEPDPEVVRKIESELGEKIRFKCYRGAGCDTCLQTGHKGRTAAFEILPMTDEIRALIDRGAGEQEIEEAAHGPMGRTMFEDAIQKVRQGITMLNEILRVIPLGSTGAGVVEAETTCVSCGQPINEECEICPCCGAAVEETEDVPPLQPTGSTEAPGRSVSDRQLRPSARPAGAAQPVDTSESVAPQTPRPRPAGRPDPPDPPTSAIAAPALPAASDGALASDDDSIGTKILVVDDDKSVLKAMSAFLPKLGFQVSTAPNGRAALDLIAQDKPHLVITEIQMPEMDGVELLKRLRQDITTTFIPVIMLTAKGDVEDRVEGFAAGCDDYIAKPVSRRKLVAMVTAALRRAYGGIG